MFKYCNALILTTLLILIIYSVNTAVAAITVTDHTQIPCEAEACAERDAIIFIHGIYGSASSFKNPVTGFDWPKEFPQSIQERRVDIYSINYDTALVPWRAGSTASVVGIVQELFYSLHPIRLKHYRSINFITHSLGGIVASNYLSFVVEKMGYSARSRTAFIIMLGTPGRGSDVAKWGHRVKRFLGFEDSLLKALERDSDSLLQLHRQTRKNVITRSPYILDCRKVAVHAAYELLRTNGVVVVDKSSATYIVTEIYGSIDEPGLHTVKGFSRDHSKIAKPTSLEDPLAFWVTQRVRKEFQRLSAREPGSRLCRQ